MSSPVELMHTYLYEVAINERLDLIDEIASIDLVDEANAIFGGPPGREGLKAHVIGFRKYVEECRIDVHKIVGATEDVIAWWSFEGLHVGPWLGKVATQRPVVGTVFSQFDVQDGLVQRYRLYLNAEFSDAIALFDTSRGCLPTLIEKHSQRQ